MSEMSHEEAISALEAAVAAGDEQAPEAPPASPAPVVEGAPVNAEPQGQAAAQGEEPGSVQQPEEGFVPFNPDELPPELIPAWRQLQAAWTPKLQEAAAIQRRYEELGGEEAIQRAMEIYERVADPSSWPTLYEELYQAMEEAGFEFEDSPSAPAVSGAPASLPAVDDPELAPLVQELQALRGRSDEQQMLIEQFYAEQDAQRQLAEQELRQAQHLANLQRQVVGIRQANPSYTDEDIRDIVTLGSFYNDDLNLAQQAFEASFARRMDRYFEAKKLGAPPSTQPVPGAGVVSEEDKRPVTLKDAEEEAVELMRRLQAAGEIDF